MRIEHRQQEAPPSSGLLRPSYRTRPEQIVGLLIFILTGFALFLLNQWLVSFSLKDNWYNQTIQAPWTIKGWSESPFWFAYYALLPFSAWMLWRRLSLRTLKLEISLFFSQFIFISLWYFCFFYLQETLLSLVLLPFLLCNTLLCVLLFWKKETLAGSLLLPSFVWIFYIMGINMTICLLNP